MEPPQNAATKDHYYQLAMEDPEKYVPFKKQRVV